MEVSVIIPTLDEEGNIRNVLSDTKKFMDGNYIYEIIVVDGQSRDKTANIAKDMGAKVIFENIGKGHAIRRGAEAARGDVIITMDADCSHIPEEMGMLIDSIRSGHDICMGSRFLKGGGTEDMPWYRKLGNKFFVLTVNSLWNSNYTDICYGYRSFSRGTVDKLDLKSDGFSIETEISIKAAKRGLKTLEIPSFEKARRSGEGKLRTFIDGYRMLKIILKELRCKD